MPTSLLILFLSPLTTPQPDSLSKLLKLGEKLVTVFNDLRVLPVLIIWPVSLDDAVYLVDSAIELLGGNELGEITIPTLVYAYRDNSKRGTDRSNQSTETPKESAMFCNDTTR